MDRPAAFPPTDPVVVRIPLEVSPVPVLPERDCETFRGQEHNPAFDPTSPVRFMTLGATIPSHVLSSGPLNGPNYDMFLPATILSICGAPEAPGLVPQNEITCWSIPGQPPIPLNIRISHSDKESYAISRKAVVLEFEYENGHRAMVGVAWNRLKCRSEEIRGPGSLLKNALEQTGVVPVVLASIAEMDLLNLSFAMH